MDGKLEKLRDRLLVCAVCMDEYKDPRILPCYHSMCLQCIINVVENSVSRHRFNCPHCRADVYIPTGGILEFPINFYIINLQDELSSREYIGACEMCNENSPPSEFRCVDCDKDICRFCIHAHRLEGHDEKPNILRIQGSSNSMSSSFPSSSNSNCAIHHQERLQLFCTTCDVPICVSCSCNDHKKHCLLPLSEKLNYLRSLLKSELTKIESDVKSLGIARKVTEDLKDEIRVGSNNCLLAFDKAASVACKSIMAEKSALEKKILSSELRQICDLDVVNMKVKALQKNMQNGLNYLSDLQDGDMCLEAYQSFKKFSSKLEESRKDFASVRLTIQKYQFSVSETSKIRELPLGYKTNIFYFGQLGCLHSSCMRLNVDSKSLETTSETIHSSWQLYKLPSLFTQLLIFCIAFIFFMLAVYIYDNIDMSQYVMNASSFVNQTYGKVMDFFQDGCKNIQQYVLLFKEKYNSFYGENATNVFEYIIFKSKSIYNQFYEYFVFKFSRELENES